MSNPGLNGLILGCLAVGVILALWQVARLFREVRWVNELRGARRISLSRRRHRCSRPSRRCSATRRAEQVISTNTLRSVLESVGMRLDEMRDVSRYLTGLLVFLGLLGTFWGLLETVSSVGGVIGAMQTVGTRPFCSTNSSRASRPRSPAWESPSRRRCSGSPVR